MQAMEKEKKMSKNNPELSRYVGRSRRLLALVVVAFMILFAFGTMPATNMHRLYRWFIGGKPGIYCFVFNYDTINIGDIYLW